MQNELLHCLNHFAVINNLHWLQMIKALGLTSHFVNQPSFFSGVTSGLVTPTKTVFEGNWKNMFFVGFKI